MKSFGSIIPRFTLPWLSTSVSDTACSTILLYASGSFLPRKIRLTTNHKIAFQYRGWKSSHPSCLWQQDLIHQLRRHHYLCLPQHGIASCVIRRSGIWDETGPRREKLRQWPKVTVCRKRRIRAAGGRTGANELQSFFWGDYLSLVSIICRIRSLRWWGAAFNLRGGQRHETLYRHRPRWFDSTNQVLIDVLYNTDNIHLSFQASDDGSADCVLSLFPKLSWVQCLDLSLVQGFLQLTSCRRWHSSHD